MKIADFRDKARPGKKLTIGEETFEILQVIKFRLDDGNFYFKCYLSDDRVIAEDSEMNIYIFVKPIDSPFHYPPPKDLKFDGKQFEFLYETGAVAEEVWGEKDFEAGETEKFWDYKAEDGSYLSLGINDKTGEKADFYGKIVGTDKVSIL